MMNKLMLSCQTVTELMEKKHRQNLSFPEKMQLYFHTAMCGACRSYEKQSLLMEQMFKTKEETVLGAGLENETEKLEEKILQELDKKNN